MKENELHQPCPICGEEHSELITFLFQDEWARIPSDELKSLKDYLRLQLAEAKARRDKSEYAKSLIHRLRAVEAEIKRRSELKRYGAPRLKKGFLSPQTIDEIKRRVNIVALMNRFVEIFPISRGGQYRFRCPVHGDGNDEHPSGMIYPQEGQWWCFGCNSGGDCFDALEAFAHMSFKEAVKFLAKEVGINLEEKRKGVRVEI